VVVMIVIMIVVMRMVVVVRVMLLRCLRLLDLRLRSRYFGFIRGQDGAFQVGSFARSMQRKGRFFFMVRTVGSRVKQSTGLFA
jgi:hypothetical protein